MPIRPAKRASPETKSFARELRADATIPEKLLWDALRGRKLAGLKFRRQHPIEPYIVDFYCAPARLIIEVDGVSHDERLAYDRARSQFFGSLGLMVIRLANDDVVHNLDGALEFISAAALPRTQSHPPYPAPLP